MRRSAFRPGVLSPSPARMARLRPRGLGVAIAPYTWALRGETLVSTLAAQTRPPRSKRTAAHAAHVPNWPTAAPLVRNSPRGWTPRSLTTIRLGGRRAVGRGCCHRSPRLRRSCRYVISGAASPLRCLTRTISARRGSTVWQWRRASSRSGASLSARPARTSGMGRVFGAHPRGEFRTSGAAVGQ